MDDHVALDLIQDVINDQDQEVLDALERIRDLVKDTGRDVVRPDMKAYEEA